MALLGGIGFHSLSVNFFYVSYMLMYITVFVPLLERSVRKDDTVRTWLVWLDAITAEGVSCTSFTRGLVLT